MSDNYCPFNKGSMGKPIYCTAACALSVPYEGEVTCSFKLMGILAKKSLETMLKFESEVQEIEHGVD